MLKLFHLNSFQEFSTPDGIYFLQSRNFVLCHQRVRVKPTKAAQENDSTLLVKNTF